MEGLLSHLGAPRRARGEDEARSLWVGVLMVKAAW